MPSVEAELKNRYSRTSSGEREVRYIVGERCPVSGTSGFTYWVEPPFGENQALFGENFVRDIIEKYTLQHKEMLEKYTALAATAAPFYGLPISADFRTGLFMYPSRAVDWLSALQIRFGELSRMNKELDGFDPVDSELIARAWQYAVDLFSLDTPVPDVIANDDGGVEFRWYMGGWELQVIVDPSETSVWMRRKATGQIWYGDLREYREHVRVVLGSLARTA
jgi:hypothetical protein